MGLSHEFKADSLLVSINRPVPRAGPSSITCDWHGPWEGGERAMRGERGGARGPDSVGRGCRIHAGCTCARAGWRLAGDIASRGVPAGVLEERRRCGWWDCRRAAARSRWTLGTSAC